MDCFRTWVCLRLCVLRSVGGTLPAAVWRRPSCPDSNTQNKRTLPGGRDELTTAQCWTGRRERQGDRDSPRTGTGTTCCQRTTTLWRKGGLRPWDGNCRKTKKKTEKTRTRHSETKNKHYKKYPHFRHMIPHTINTMFTRCTRRNSAQNTAKRQRMPTQLSFP